MKTCSVLLASLGLAQGYGFFGGQNAATLTSTATGGLTILQRSGPISASGKSESSSGVGTITGGLKQHLGVVRPPGLADPSRFPTRASTEWKAPSVPDSDSSQSNRLGFLEKALAKISYNAPTSPTVADEGVGSNHTFHLHANITRPSNVSAVSESSYDALLDSKDSGAIKHTLPIDDSASDDEDAEADLLGVNSEDAGMMGVRDTQTLGLLNAGDINGQISGVETDAGETYASSGKAGTATTVAASAGLVAAVGGGVMMWRRRSREPIVESFSSFGRRNSNESLSRRYLHV